MACPPTHSPLLRYLCLLDPASLFARYDIVHADLGDVEFFGRGWNSAGFGVEKEACVLDPEVVEEVQASALAVITIYVSTGYCCWVDSRTACRCGVYFITACCFWVRHSGSDDRLDCWDILGGRVPCFNLKNRRLECDGRTFWCPRRLWNSCKKQEDAAVDLFAYCQ